MNHALTASITILSVSRCSLCPANVPDMRRIALTVRRRESRRYHSSASRYHPCESRYHSNESCHRPYPIACAPSTAMLEMCRDPSTCVCLIRQFTKASEFARSVQKRLNTQIIPNPISEVIPSSRRTVYEQLAGCVHHGLGEARA